MTDQDIDCKAGDLPRHVAHAGRPRDNPALVNEIMEIGRTFDRRGGISEMRGVFNMVPPMPGKRMVEPQWMASGRGQARRLPRGLYGHL